MARPTYCLLDCEDAEKWKGHQQLYHDNFSDQGATWEHFKCFNRELPQLDTLGKYAAVFITGGHYSAYEDRSWIHELAEWLGVAVKAHPEVKFLGICFGCQILARGLGGVVGKNPSGRFVLKVEDLRVSQELQQHPAFQLALSEMQATARVAPGAALASTSPAAAALPAREEEDGEAEVQGNEAQIEGVTNHSSSSGGSRQPGAASGDYTSIMETQSGNFVAAEVGSVDRGHNSATLTTSSSSSSSSGLVRLLESHGDQVLRLPEGAVTLAESDSAQFEIWGYGANVLAVQGHPELDCQVAMEKIYPAVTTNMTPEERMASAESLSSRCPDSGLVLRLMKHFAELGAASSPAAAQETVGLGNGLAVPAQGMPPGEGAVARAATSSELLVGTKPGDTAAAENAHQAAFLASASAVQQAESTTGRAPGGSSSSNVSGGAIGSDVQGNVDRALRALGLGVETELARGPQEYRLLQECNAATEKRFDHMSRVVTQANKILQSVQAQQGALDPALQAIDALEAQVCQLEGVMAHMEATAARLQHSLDHLPGRASAR